MAESSQEFEEPPPEADSDSPHSEAIIDVYATLRNKLEPQNLLGDLYQERLITDTEMARIKAASVVYEKNDELLEAVRRRSGKDISKFCQILLREQEHCGIVLKGALHKRGVDVTCLKVLSPNPPELNHKRPKYSPLQGRLKEHYIRLLLKVRKACVEVSVEEMKLICGQLLRDKAQELPHGELKQKVENGLERLQISEKSDSMLECLLTNSDYLNCELVHQLVTLMENDELMKAWKTYCGELVEACRLTLDCWSKSEVTDSRDSDTLTIGFETAITPDSLPMERILALKGFLCHVMGMKEAQFVGCASSTVTLFFAVSTSRLPFLLHSLSRHRKTLEDFSIELAFVPGKFIYSIVLDQEYELFQAPEQTPESESKLDKIAGSLEVVQSTQYELKAMILNQESTAKERHKLEEQMATQNKSYYETLMHKEKLGSERLKSSFVAVAEQLRLTVDKQHKQVQAELKQLQEEKTLWQAELMNLLVKTKTQRSSQVEVPAKMAGIIIGVKGQNVRRIEAKTGVSKLKLVDGPNENVSIVKIFGNERARKAAQKEIRLCCAAREQVKEKKICFLTLAPDYSTVSFAEYKGVLPPLFKPERRFRKFYCLKLNCDAQAKKGGELPHTRTTLVPWSSVRNSDRLTARFLCAVEEALISGPAHLELEARFGSIFFRAAHPLQSHELKKEYPISSVEKDAIVDTSIVLGITSWTFAAILPKTAEAVAMSDLGMVFIGEPELVNITLTYIPEEADCVQYVLHACRGKDGKFHALNVQPKVVKALMFDCLPLHGNLDVQFAFSSAAVSAEEEQTMMNTLARKMTDGLEVINGVVMLSKESLKEVEVDFRISFIRYEKKKMYLIRSDGSLLILAHFSVEECDIVRQDLPDEAVEFPLKERHYELELKNCQWLADFYHLVGSNWKEQLSAQGCDVSQIDVVPKPVDPATIVQELEHFAKYALQITPGQQE